MRRPARVGASTQNMLTMLEVGGLLLVVVAGVLLGNGAGRQRRSAALRPRAAGVPRRCFGLAMVFVLLTYGGWNEAAYISAEVQGRPRSIVRALVLSIVHHHRRCTLLRHWAYLNGLGLDGMAKSASGRRPT